MADPLNATPRIEARDRLIEVLEYQVSEWIAYADKLEAVLELVCGQSKDNLIKLHAEQGLELRLVRPDAALSRSP